MKFILLLFLLHECAGLYFSRRDVLKVAPLFLVDKDEIKICKDCKFFKKDFSTETKFGHCSNFPIQEKDNYFLVDGFNDTSPTSYHYCEQLVIAVVVFDVAELCL